MHLSFFSPKKQAICFSYTKLPNAFLQLNVKTKIPLLKKKKKRKVWRIGRLHIYVNLQKTWKHAAPTHQENYYLCHIFCLICISLRTQHSSFAPACLYQTPNVSRASSCWGTALTWRVQEFCSLPVVRS